MKGVIIKLIILNFGFIFYQPFLFAESSEEYKKIQPNYKLSRFEKLDPNEKNIVKSEYILGSGDLLKINFLGLELFDGLYPIDLNGNINVPEIREFRAAGLTLKELKANLENSYKKFIKNPDLIINIAKYREVNVFISGEVKSPGLYSLNYAQEINSLNNIQVIEKFPQVFDALKQSRGFTNYADLSNITIIRKNSSSQGGGQIKTTLNLLALLLEGDQSQNIRILDGDVIKVPKANILLKDQIISINKTNINPSTIVVFITGNVKNAGPSTLLNGSSLNQAIASTGGKKLLTGNIEFLRFDSSGTLNKKIFRYDQFAQPNSKKNPILMDGDIINVNRTLLGKSTQIISEVSNPLFSGYGLYKFIFGD